MAYQHKLQSISTQLHWYSWTVTLLINYVIFLKYYIKRHLGNKEQKLYAYSSKKKLIEKKTIILCVLNFPIIRKQNFSNP